MGVSQALANMQMIAEIPTMGTYARGTETTTQRIMDVSIIVLHIYIHRYTYV